MIDDVLGVLQEEEGVAHFAWVEAARLIPSHAAGVSNGPRTCCIGALVVYQCTHCSGSWMGAVMCDDD